MADEEPKAPEPQQPEQEPAKPEDAPVLDKHGQLGINKERHDREIAELTATIKELQAKVDEQAKTEAGREEMGKRIAELEQALKDNELNHKLEMQKCKSVKAARALLEDYENDVEKLKAAQPWLFEENQPTGATGGKPAAPAQRDIMDELREAAGLKKKG